jgi:glycosyltransferase involved in cell wall biosynthesis
MPDLLLLSDDVVGPKMAGPGIRAWEMAKALSRRFEVTLAAPDYSPGAKESEFFRDAPFGVAFYSVADPGRVKALAQNSRLILFQGYILSKFPALKSLGRPLIADIYDPFVLENLFVHQRKIRDLRDREQAHLRDLRVFNDLVLQADHFVCASERQRDLFTGSLMSLSRIGPRLTDTSPDLRDLVSVVPFGISADDARDASGPGVFREIFPAVAEGDLVLLWGGVISNWFDPASLLHAFGKAVKERPDLKLLFLSTTHPNPLLPAFDMAGQARRLASALSLLDKSVFFHDGWVEYGRRAEFFERVAVGVSIHKTHFETRFAFRTRMLDYIKFGLPVLCTEGDYFADLVDEERLGEVVRPEDVEGIRKSILALASDPGRRADIRQRMENIKPRFAWERVIEPLAAYCERVLSGAVKPGPRPNRRKVASVCAGKRGSTLGRWLKRRFWSRFQKMSPETAARIRRRLKI